MICDPYRSAFQAVLSCSIIMGTVMVARGQPNCNTALGHIANVIAKKPISDNKDKACSGLKKGLIGIDRTEKLVLSKFKLCEDGPVVSAEITLKIKCSTSSAAFISASVEESINATASANLDSCSS
jgi:hypothetical protein